MRYKEHDYNVGDKVIFIKEDSNYGFYIGKISTITVLDEKDNTICFDNGIDFLITGYDGSSIFEYIEPYAEENKKIPCMCEDNTPKRVTSVNVLGTEYKIIYDRNPKNPKMVGLGYIEFFAKEIVIDDTPAEETTIKELKVAQQQVLRHEIIHAFLFESGLDSSCDWARNEEMVDYFALQFEKIEKAINSTKEKK